MLNLLLQLGHFRVPLLEQLVQLLAVGALDWRDGAPYPLSNLLLAVH